MTKLGDFINIKHGYAFEGKYFTDRATGDALVTPGNFAIGGGFKGSKLKYYDGPVPPDYVLDSGEVIVTMTDLSKNMDTLGYPAIVPEMLPGQRLLHNQRVGLVEFKTDSLDRDYLYYFMRGKDYRDEVLASSTGTTVHHTSPSRILNTTIDLPPINKQREIACVLRAIDDKLRSNRVANERIVQLLDTMSAHIASQLPSVQLGVVATLAKNTVDPGRLGDVLVDHYSLPAFDLEARPERVSAMTIKSNKQLLDQPSILISRLNPRIDRTWWAESATASIRLASTEYATLVASDLTSLAAIWLAVRDAFFRAEIARRVTGTSGSHQRIRPDDLMSVDVPDVRAASDQMSARALGLLQLRDARAQESERLASLRDALLPELLAGRLRVKDRATL